MNFSNEPSDLTQFSAVIDDITLKVTKALNVLTNIDHYFDCIKIIYDDLLLFNTSVIQCESIFTHDTLLSSVLLLLETVFKLCVKHNSSGYGDTEQISVMLKNVFKIIIEFEQLIVKMIGNAKPSIYDSNKNLLVLLSSGLSSCAVEAEKLDMRASLPLWRCLSSLTSTYCGIFSQTAPASLYASLLGNYRQSWLLRYQCWQSAQSSDAEKQLKMAFFLMKCALYFVGDYQTRLGDDDDDTMVKEVYEFVYCVMRCKLDLVEQVDNDGRQGVFDDSVLFGAEVVAARLVDNVARCDLITAICLHATLTGDALSVTLFLAIVLRTLTAANDREATSAWIHGGVMDVIVDILIKIEVSCETKKVDYVYEQLMIETCSLLCVQSTCEITVVESFLWSQVLSTDVSCSLPWLFFTDVLTFMARYGPISIPMEYSSTLATMLVAMTDNTAPITSILRIGTLLNRFIRLVPEDYKMTLLTKTPSITFWLFYPWCGTDDLSGVAPIIDGIFESFIDIVRNGDSIQLCVIQQVVLALMLVDKLHKIHITFNGADAQLRIITKIILSLADQSDLSEMNRLKKTVNEMSHYQDVTDEEYSPESKRLKSSAVLAILTEMSESSKRLCSLVQTSSSLLDTELHAQLQSIVATLSSLLSNEARMRAIIQRVKSASVTVDGKIVSEIGRGVLVLVGVSRTDVDKDIEYIVRKILNTKIFPDANSDKRWHLSVKDLNLEILCVSQFTLYSVLKGNKLDFHNAMNPVDSKEIYDRFISQLRAAYKQDLVKDGVFGAMMDVALINDGPVTVTLDSNLNKISGDLE